MSSTCYQDVASPVHLYPIMIITHTDNELEMGRYIDASLYRDTLRP